MKLNDYIKQLEDLKSKYGFMELRRLKMNFDIKDLKSWANRHVVNTLSVETEKKYRPFETIDEFVKTIGDIGTIITYREKKEPSQEMRGIFTGYMWDCACRGWILGLGATLYRLENLFELAEYKYKNEWQPFGVEE